MMHRFLDFELDETLFELRRGGEVVTTQARVFAFIAYLLRHRSRVIGKEELIRELWKAQAVTDAAISQVVMLARKALSDEGDTQRIIKTVRGRGFRFVAEVAETVPAAPAHAASPPQDAAVAHVAPPAAPVPRAFPTLGPTGGTAAAVAVAIDSTAAATRGRLVGREHELRDLTQRIAATRDGRGGLVLVEGEPGIGKTALATELATIALEHGLDVQWGRAWEEGGAPPFWPWVQVLRGLVATEGEDRVRSFVGRSSPELASLLPELTAPGTEAPSDTDSSRAQFRLFDAMANFLHRACGTAAPSGRRPRLFVLDDLHAVDDASVQMLRFLAPDLAHSGLLIVATLRDFELQRLHVLAELASGCAASERLRLKSLTEPDVARWLECKLGRPPAPLLARGLFEASGGNPLLLAELARRFERDAPERLDDLRALANEPLPTRILRAVRSHLSELPEPALRALSAASALGREFPLSVLAPILDCTEAALLETLGPALQRGVVQPCSSQDRLIFSHAMVCQAVYADIPAGARVELHRQIAEQLAKMYGPERVPLYEVAHHYALAAASGCRPQALDYAQRAAQRAADMRAFEVAAELYDRCVSLAEAEGLDHQTIHLLLGAAGEAWYRVGHLEHAIARYNRGAELARAEHHAQRFAEATLAAASALRGVVLYDRALQLQLRDALEMTPEGDSVIRAGLLGASALSARSGTVVERDAAARAAIEMARRLEDDSALCWLLNARHLAMWGAAHPRELLASTTEMAALARKSGDTEVLLDSYMWRITDNTELGDLSSALQAVEMYRFEVERSGSPWHRYMLLMTYAFHALAEGDLGLAREYSERCWRWGMRIREPLAGAFYVVRSLFIQLEEGFVHGDPQRSAAPELHEPPDYVPSEYRPLWTLAWAIENKTMDAERSVAQFLANDAAGLVADSVRKPLLSVMAQVCWLHDDAAHAAKIYPMLAPWAGLHMMLQAGVYLGPISYYLGLLATTMSQLKAAVAHFESALAEVVPSFAWVGRIHHAYAAALSRMGGRDACAYEHAAEALSLAERYGMADLREASRALLGRLRPDGGRSSATPVPMA